LQATFVTKNPSRLARIGIERRETRFWSCARQAANQPNAGRLVLARLVKKESTWNFTRARVGSSLVINTGKQKLKLEDTSYKDGKTDEEKILTGKITIRPRQPGFTPYRSENCGREPKAGCAYWQRVESTWSGTHSARSENGKFEELAKFKDVGVIAYQYASRATPFLGAAGMPWLISASFEGITEGKANKEVLTIEGHDPTTLPNLANKMCAWTEHDRTPGLVGMLHTIHQTFPELGKLSAYLDSEYRDVACAACGTISEQSRPPIKSKCIS